MILLIGAAVAFYLFTQTDTGSEAVNKGDFAVMLFNSLRRKLDVQPALLATAMGVLESGYGTSAAYSYGFNVFNITDGGYWSRKGKPVYSQANADDEYNADGTKRRIGQVWRVYSGIDESVDDYLSFLSEQNGGRYKEAYRQLLAADSFNFVHELYAAGYFTLAPEDYLRRLSGAYDTAVAMIGVV